MVVFQCLSLLLFQLAVDADDRPPRGFLKISGPEMIDFGMPIALPLEGDFGPALLSEPDLNPEPLAEAPSLPDGLDAMFGALGGPPGIGGVHVHSHEYSSRFKTEKGDDGKEHRYKIDTECTDGKCKETKNEINSMDAPSPFLPARASDGPAMPLAIASGFGDGSPFPGDLDQLLGQLFGGGGGEFMAPPGVQSLRLRVRPDSKFNVAPLGHSKNDDGSEVISGDIGKGLNSSTLSVEQHGHAVIVACTLNQSVGGLLEPVGIKHRVRLGFQPAKKEKAHYDPATGYFQMVFPRLDSDEFDPKVEVIFGSADSQSKAPTAKKLAKQATPITAMITPGKSTNGEKSQTKPKVILEVGDEL